MQIQIRSQLIWIYTVCKSRVYPDSAGQELKRLHEVYSWSWWNSAGLSFCHWYVILRCLRQNTPKLKYLIQFKKVSITGHTFTPFSFEYKYIHSHHLQIKSSVIFFNISFTCCIFPSVCLWSYLYRNKDISVILVYITNIYPAVSFCVSFLISKSLTNFQVQLFINDNYIQISQQFMYKLPYKISTIKLSKFSKEHGKSGLRLTFYDQRKSSTTLKFPKAESAPILLLVSAAEKKRIPYLFEVFEQTGRSKQWRPRYDTMSCLNWVHFLPLIQQFSDIPTGVQISRQG